jgi:DNA primase
MIWPEENRYWCRRCDAKGDAIQFCRDFQNLSFRDACSKVNSNRTKTAPRPILNIRSPTGSWIEKATLFAQQAHQRLLIDPIALSQVVKRGLSLAAIENNRLGWNPVQAFYRRADWGLEERDDRKWLCLPSGIVIPLFDGESIHKLKIRKSEWQKGDQYGKYYETPGSSNALTLFGDPTIRSTVLVEAEFDAMLIIQEAGDICNCVALGGANKKPQIPLRDWLRKQKTVLFSLDFDDAGKHEYSNWQKNYTNLEPWPVPEEKSPGDYFTAGGNLKKWVQAGLKI